MSSFYVHFARRQLSSSPSPSISSSLVPQNARGAFSDVDGTGSITSVDDAGSATTNSMMMEPVEKSSVLKSASATAISIAQRERRRKLQQQQLMHGGAATTPPKRPHRPFLSVGGAGNGGTSHPHPVVNSAAASAAVIAAARGAAVAASAPATVITEAPDGASLGAGEQQSLGSSMIAVAPNNPASTKSDPGSITSLDLTDAGAGALANNGTIVHHEQMSQGAGTAENTPQRTERAGVDGERKEHYDVDNEALEKNCTLMTTGKKDDVPKSTSYKLRNGKPKIIIDLYTLRAIREEVLGMPLPCTMFAMCSALGSSERIMAMHRVSSISFVAPSSSLNSTKGNRTSQEMIRRSDWTNWRDISRRRSTSRLELTRNRRLLKSTGRSSNGGNGDLSELFNGLEIEEGNGAIGNSQKWSMLGRSYGRLVSRSVGARISSSRKSVEEYRAMKLRGAFRLLSNQVGAVTRKITSWEEAQGILSAILEWPLQVDQKKDKNERQNEEGRDMESQILCGGSGRKSRRRKRESVEEYHDRITEKARYLGTIRPDQKWRQIERYIPRRIKSGLVFSSIAKKDDDNGHIGQVDTCSDAATMKVGEDKTLMGYWKEQGEKRIFEVSEKEKETDELIENRIAAREAERKAATGSEAEAKTVSVLPELTADDEEMLHDTLYGPGPEDEVVATAENDTVQRGSMHRLRPGKWLNDEVIHYFLTMLARRDEKLCRENPDRKRSHFFKSFFITKLLDENGHHKSYKYANVKRWSKKVPGKDVFNLDKIIIPVNVGGVHWCCAVIFMLEKRIQFYDSMGGGGGDYLEGLLKYLQDEHRDKKKKELDTSDWMLVECERDTPQQENGFDCGVFTCMFADYLSRDAPLSFTQEDVTECRRRIALSIIKGSALH